MIGSQGQKEVSLVEKHCLISLLCHKNKVGPHGRKGIKKKIPIRWEVRLHYSTVAFNCGIPTVFKLRKDPESRHSNSFPKHHPRQPLSFPPANTDKRYKITF